MRHTTQTKVSRDRCSRVVFEYRLCSFFSFALFDSLQRKQILQIINRLRAVGFDLARRLQVVCDERGEFGKWVVGMQLAMVQTLERKKNIKQPHKMLLLLLLLLFEACI